MRLDEAEPHDPMVRSFAAEQRPVSTGSHNKTHSMHNRNRNDLMGRVYPQAPDYTQNAFREQNDEKIGLLGSKIAQLKNLSIQINGEVREQNSMLNGFSDSMSNADGMLGGTMKNLKTLVNSGGSNNVVKVIGFTVAVLTILTFAT